MTGTASLYQEAIKTFARAANGHGKLPMPTGEAKLDNPLCGDRVRVQVTMAAGGIVAVAHETKGCLLCQAAASVIGLRAAGHDQAAIDAMANEVEKMLADGSPLSLAWPELSMFEPARAYSSRHGCVLLPFRALQAALTESRRSQDGAATAR